MLTYLDAELRSWDIAVAGLGSYVNLRAQLLTWDECWPLAADLCAQAGIPTEARVGGALPAELIRTSAIPIGGDPSAEI